VIVGSSQWVIYPFKEFIDIATNAIEEDQAITHCSNTNCIRCNDAVKGGPFL
jgi:aminoglycoside 3-N-acetyltransferase